MPEQLLQRVDALLAGKQDRMLQQVLQQQDISTIAAVLEDLPSGKRKCFTLLPPEMQAEVILLLSDPSRETLLKRLPVDTIARFLHFSDEDDATDILQIVTAERRTHILKLMRGEKRLKIEKLLTFSSETAGGLMDLNFVIVQFHDVLRDIIQVVREHVRSQKHSPVVLVADEHEHIVGFIPYRNVLFKEPQARASDLLQPILVTLHTTDREKLLDTAADHRKTEVICVTDEKQRVLGVIHLPDLLKIAEEEATEDVYQFAGVDAEEDVSHPVKMKVQRRSKWLAMNLMLALMGSSVVSLFQDDISRVALLAVYMPLVAGEGGNAATQALAVTVRGLAEGEISWARARRIILREATAGVLNGMLMGLLAATIALLFGGPLLLGVALMAALTINLFVAGLLGALVPFVLKRLKIDPATASSIFVTPITDVCGFMAFLGLGSLLL